MAAPKYTHKDREKVVEMAKAGYSTAEISQTIGVSVSTVKRWMAGHFNHSAARARRQDKKRADKSMTRAGSIKAGKHWWTLLTGWAK